MERIECGDIGWIDNKGSERAVESLWKKRFVADAPIPPQT